MDIMEMETGIIAKAADYLEMVHAIIPPAKVLLRKGLLLPESKTTSKQTAMSGALIFKM